ncbi:MAG: ankyrin repeat domain-containing protein [Alphaproteobacteria bacterium]|nr:ankyrin repeat domain-containing protein [Alphaproteobacteria bacterium]
MRAAESGRLDIVAPIIAAGADPRYQRPGRKRDPKGFIGPGQALRTVLMNAAGSGAPDLVETILKAKPDVNARDEYGWTALHFAVTPGVIPEAWSAERERVIALLRAAGADPTARNALGKTPADLSEDPRIKAALERAPRPPNTRSTKHVD